MRRYRFAEIFMLAFALLPLLAAAARGEYFDYQFDTNDYVFLDHLTFSYIVDGKTDYKTETPFFFCMTSEVNVPSSGVPKPSSGTVTFNSSKEVDLYYRDNGGDVHQMVEGLNGSKIFKVAADLDKDYRARVIYDEGTDGNSFEVQFRGNAEAGLSGQQVSFDNVGGVSESDSFPIIRSTEYQMETCAPF
ncbi:MAG: hypothetical protein LBR87_09135, partial [Synergistaceae bacterium]|nr:hypothetical protein [Synergistaceae bacterium]